MIQIPCLLQIQVPRALPERPQAPQQVGLDRPFRDAEVRGDLLRA
jgi:hypothetical protein